LEAGARATPQRIYHRWSDSGDRQYKSRGFKTTIRPPSRPFCKATFWRQAHEQEKKLQDKKGFFIDRAFHLFAIMRRAFTESVQIVFFVCLDLNRKSSDSNKLQCKSRI